MSITTARQAYADMRAFINTVPDHPGPSGMDVDAKFEEVDRLINYLREVSARQVVILGELLEAWPPPPTT